MAHCNNLKRQVSRLLVLAMLITPMNIDAAKYAVLAAINDYPLEDDFKHAIDDIHLVKDMLVQVANWSTANITMLEGSGAEEDDILGALEDLQSIISSGDTVLFMFSGHGAEQGYGLMPYDSYKHWSYCISPADLNYYLNQLNTDEIVVILDASKSDIFNDEIDKGVILMSADEGKDTWEDDQYLNHGVFSYFIGKGMAGYADLNGSSISAEEIFTYADPLVIAWGEAHPEWEVELDPLMDDNYSGGFDFLVKTFTLSGTLSHNEIWSGSSLTLTGNVTVPSGITLTLLENVVIDFNSKSLTINNGGNLVIKSDLEEYNITVSNGGTLVIYSDLEVPSGSTIAFSSGSTLELNGYTIAEDGGTIYWNGQPADGDVILWDGTELEGFATVQSAINAASSGQDVYLGDGQYGYVYMKSGVDLDGTGPGTQQSGLSGVTFDEASASCLSDVRVHGWGAMIEMDNCTGICAASNVIVENSSGLKGIDISQSFSAVLEEVYISGVDEGVYVHGTSYPSIYDGAYEEIDYYGLHMAGPGTMSVGGTWFCYNDNYDIRESDGSATVYASYCTWSDNPNYTTYGNVYVYPEPPYHDECGMYKSIAIEPPLAALPADGVDADEEAYIEAYEVFVAARQRLVDDWRAGKEPNPQDYAEELTEAIDGFKALTAMCAGPSSVRALGAVAACYGLLEDNEAAYDYLTSVANTSQYAPLKPYARSLLVGHYRRVGDFEMALALADAILASAADDHLAGETLYAKGLIYERDLGDSTQAATMYAAMVLQYPDHPTTSLALERLEAMDEDIPAPAPAAPDEEPEVTEISLVGYPNPFNPTATVRFGLPEAGNVTLIVYDLMGREVVRLAEGYREAGWQQVIWDGRDTAGREVPTGMYLARLVTPQGVKAIKLVMMK